MTKLSSKQLVVLDALLSGGAVSEAAQLADVHPRSVYRWLAGPGEFSERLADGQELATFAAVIRLSALLDTAISALVDVLDDPGGRGQNVRRMAALTIVEMFLKVKEHNDLAGRIVALEERLGLS